MKKYKKALTMMDIVVSFAILSCFILFLSIFFEEFYVARGRYKET